MANDHFIDPARDMNVYQPRTLGNKIKCWYCGSNGPTEGDHFYPKSLGGRLKVRSCIKCNREKGDLTPLEWINYLNVLINRCRKHNGGCDRGQFIKSLCPDNCMEYEKLLRMRYASLTLWKRLRYSVRNHYPVESRDKLSQKLTCFESCNNSHSKH